MHRCVPGHTTHAKNWSPPTMSTSVPAGSLWQSRRSRTCQGDWQANVSRATIAWARSLGEFGPILVFAGATRMHTEVLSTTVFLELSVGQLEAAVAVSLLMVLAAMSVLGVVRLLGTKVVR